jgi:magnesium transporter
MLQASKIPEATAMTDPINDIEDEAFGVTDRLVADVMDAVDGGEARDVDAILDPLHPADVAHLIEQIDGRKRRDLLQVWKGVILLNILMKISKR